MKGAAATASATAVRWIGEAMRDSVKREKATRQAKSAAEAVKEWSRSRSAEAEAGGGTGPLARARRRSRVKKLRGAIDLAIERNPSKVAEGRRLLERVDGLETRIDVVEGFGPESRRLDLEEVDAALGRVEHAVRTELLPPLG